MHITRTEVAVSLAITGAFNQYSLDYTADVPLRGTFTYTAAGAAHSEDFFLEAGEQLRFSSFIDDYLCHGTADAASRLTLRTISHESGRFELHALSVKLRPVIAEETFFFENHRYRVGVELCWGGGLSYLLDKACPVAGLGSLLNRFDTGRLVQQSYYGTAEPPYECGEFMGNRWAYNPVQGGDRGNHKSKLINVCVSEREVYVKCRPRDWGHDGGVTYAYMENWYRLNGDCLVVDNRFVDFSGWIHPVRRQEVPAFYTVSYLGDYHWYDGCAPWTDDALSCRDDLPFWPDDWPYCTFHLADGNSETWSAFTDKSGYGLGLFTPGVRTLLAGRYKHNDSTDPGAEACNYIAPIVDLAIRCFEPIEYRYFLTAGRLEDIRARFGTYAEQMTRVPFRF